MKRTCYFGLFSLERQTMNFWSVILSIPANAFLSFSEDNYNPLPRPDYSKRLHILVTGSAASSFGIVGYTDSDDPLLFNR